MSDSESGRERGEEDCCGEDRGEACRGPRGDGLEGDMAE